MSLILLTGSATEADVIDRINKIIGALQRMEASGPVDEAIVDLRKTSRELQELGAHRGGDHGPASELMHRYARPNEKASTGREIVFYGRADPKTKVWIPGFFDDIRDGRPTIQREIQRAVEDRAIVHTILRAPLKQAPQESLTPILDAQIERLIGMLPDEFRRAFTDQAGSGAEWIPTDVLPVLLEEIQWARQLASLFTEIEIDRDTKLPYQGGGLIPYLRNGGTDDDPPNIGSSTQVTDEREFNLKNVSARTLIDRDAAEDSILPTLPLLRMALSTAINAGEEDGIVNGDTGTHQDTGLASWNPDSYYGATPGGGTLDHRRGWIGIRARSTDVSNTANLSSWASSPDLATLITARTSLKGPKQGPRDACWLPSGQALRAMLKVSEFQTLEKYGPGAVVFSGEVGRVGGAPVVESQFATDDLNASGVYDNTTKTKGTLNCFLRSRWVRAVKRGHGVRIEAATHIGKNYIELVGSRRLTYKNIGGSTEKNCYTGYNI